MKIKTILVALTLEDDSPRVAGRAIQLAEQHGARLIGLHVIEDFPLGDAGLPDALAPDELAGAVKADGTARLRALLETAEQEAAIHVETGKPHDAIMLLAAAQDADLIVIGPGVPKSLREKMFGSTADRVVRSSSCPVLVVRQNAGAPYGHIVIGMDFSEHARAAAGWAERLSPMAVRSFIHASEIPLAFEQAMLKTGTSGEDIERYRDARAEAAHRQIVELFGENGRLPPSSRARIVRGDAATALIEASRRRTVDLVALGTQGSSAVARQLLGSVARKVLAGAGCDVLVVPGA